MQLWKKQKTNYIVVGAASGTDVQSLLEENNVFIDEYFDNSKLFLNSVVIFDVSEVVYEIWGNAI